MADSENSIPPNAPLWMSHLLKRIDALVEGQRELTKLYRDLYDATHDLLAGHGRELEGLAVKLRRLEVMVDDNRERIKKLEVEFGGGTDTERPPPEAS